MLGKRLDAAPLISAVGGLILLISLFLHWYEPGLSAWTAFEVLDLLLAALGIAAMWTGASSVLAERARTDGALPVIGCAAFVIVVSQLINHPPAAQGAGVQSGAWLGLAGSGLMAAGGLLGVAGVSLSLSFSPRHTSREPERGEPAPPRRRGPSPASEAAAVEPEVQDELYPEQERRGPIGADDPEPWTASPDDETLTFEPERDERT